MPSKAKVVCLLCSSGRCFWCVLWLARVRLLSTTHGPFSTELLPDPSGPSLYLSQRFLYSQGQELALVLAWFHKVPVWVPLNSSPASEHVRWALPGWCHLWSWWDPRHWVGTGDKCWLWKTLPPVKKKLLPRKITQLSHICCPLLHHSAGTFSRKLNHFLKSGLD